MKKGDYVFYFAQDGGTVPARVMKVNAKTLRIKGDFIGGKDTRNVSMNNCQLQSEWAKENGV